ncbi:Bicaudal D-related -like protein [Halotydeus destructor]|nr:Bicaudal D-related -like protein [Halotydeus destructor]
MGSRGKKFESGTFRRPKATVSSPPQLEEYIYELEHRDDDAKPRAKNFKKSPSTDSNSELNSSRESVMSSPDIVTQLAQKEKDLILAAELGKALLERNEELSRANERIAEEYSHKLELLEQEKHGLRRRLDTLESEYDSRLAELQADLVQSRKELTDQQTLVKLTEKEKSSLLAELVEQNHRLTRELTQATESEEQLQSQLQALRDQFNARRSNLHDHVAQLEGLREEIHILSKRKSDLEKRISAVTEERENLSMSLEESSDRIMMLEKRNQELEIKIQQQYKELDEVRHANGVLNNKLEMAQCRTRAAGHAPTSPANSTSGPSSAERTNGQPVSLFNEIEMSSSSSIEDELRSTFGHHEDDDDIECDMSTDMPLLMTSDLGSDDMWKFKQELVEIYQQIRRLHRDLQRRKENTNLNSTPDSGVHSTPEELQTNQVRVGLLTSVVKELALLINDFFPDDESPCSGCRSVAVERRELEHHRKDLVEKKETIKRQSEEINELLKRVTIQETELNAAKEEVSNLKETLNSDGRPMDEMVKRAFELRDSAVSRKNAVEIELAKTRIEVMHINSQLMEAIQQKVELSQQLEQWQVDMQTLIDEQLNQKMLEDKLRRSQSKANSSLSAATNPTPTSQPGSGLAAYLGKGKMLKLWR